VHERLALGRNGIRLVVQAKVARMMKAKRLQVGWP
jgi:hypothetical protein